MSGAPTPNGDSDFEESETFESSQTNIKGDAPAAQQAETVGAYGDDESFEESGDARAFAPVPPSQDSTVPAAAELAVEAAPPGDAAAPGVTADAVAPVAPVAASTEPPADPSPTPPASEATQPTVDVSPPAAAPPAEDVAAQELTQEATESQDMPTDARAPTPADAALSEAEGEAPVPAEEPPADAPTPVQAQAAPAEAAPTEVAPCQPEPAEAAPAEHAPEASAAVPAPQPENAFSVSETTGALHLAAKGGKVDQVQFLLRNRADPLELDSDGRMALEVADALGHADVSQVLRDAMGLPAKEAADTLRWEEREADFEEDVPTQSAQKEGVDTQKVAEEAEQPLQQSPPGAEPEPRQRQEPAKPTPAKRSPASHGMSKSSSTPSQTFGSFRDLKERTAGFGAVTTEGVKRGPTYSYSLSNFKGSPVYTMRPKDKNASFMRSVSTPAPCAYETSNSLEDDNNLKYHKQPKFSFGGEKRFGQAMHTSKRQPGPGAYTPKDPVLAVSTKIGFGSSMRQKGAIIAQSNPGPGAYESRTTIGEGLTYTARGRHNVHYVHSKALPGPGAYSPSTQMTLQQSPKTGFGTSRRDGMGALRGLGPGPGSYDLQNYKNMGTDAPKYSASSRRKQLDINSYLTPGPGSYNSHITCFGAPRPGL